MVIFELDTKEAQQTFIEIKKILTVVKNWKMTTRIELTVLNGLVQLNGIGFTKTIPSLTTGTCKLVVPVFHWFELVKMTTEKKLKVVVTEGEAMVGKVSVKVQTTFFETDRILRSIQLPANPLAIDFLRLEYQGYTPEEIQFNKLVYQVESAHKELTRSVQKAAEILAGFRITKEELREMILEKMRA
jgi:hypothetical protein